MSGRRSHGYSENRRGGGGDNRRGGGGRGRGGRHSDGGRGRFGGRAGGRGGRGRGGRNPLPDLSMMKSSLTNIILANTTPGFQFYLYSIKCEDGNGEGIDSRHRRKYLFDLGFWDGLLKSMHPKEKEDLKRVVFFNGSFFFSSRKIDALDPTNFPMRLPTTAKAEGDQIKVMQMVHYLAPNELQRQNPTCTNRPDEISFDNRCNNCTKAFTDVGSLLQHCQQTGHAPVYADQAQDSSSVVEPRPAQLEVFTAYVNGALQRALSERLQRWGSEFIDPSNVTEPKDRNGNPLGVRVYQAFSCQLGCMRPGGGGAPLGPVHLALTVDLRAKIVRTMSMLDHFCGNSDPMQFRPSRSEQDRAKRDWIGEVVISMHDKKCYSVIDLLFDHSPNSLLIEGLGISHSEYFLKRKNITLKYPNAKPMIAVLGRRNQTIYLPAELVAGNELERRVKEQLPMIASYRPEARNEAIEKIRSYLIPGAQKTKGGGGLLPALGVVLRSDRLKAKAQVLPIPMMMAAGVTIPKERGENWAPMLNRASFNVNPRNANTLGVVLVFNERLERGAKHVYAKLRNMVNSFNACYRLSDQPVQMIKAGDRERHWGAVEKYLSGEKQSYENVFVLDFNKPRGASDPAYPVVKQLLTKHGFISQFVNFNTYQHDEPRDEKRSSIILQGVARQILHKTGVRLWWVKIPQSLPTPTVFVGVDVFHAPRVYDPKQRKRVAKASCAAIIVQVLRPGSEMTNQIELYTKSFAREPGREFELGDALKTTVSSALRELNVEPQSCIVWRDGIGDSAFNLAAMEEINAVQAGLNGEGPVGGDGPTRNVPLSYVVCQKRIDTKFLTANVGNEPDGKYGAPSGTLVQGIQGLEHDTFYINGRAPPYSTAKPVRYIVIKRDDRLKQVPLPELTWEMCHDYPNWTGPIKVPSVVQMAHKLAELGGGFADCGSNIDASKLKNTVHFL